MTSSVDVQVPKVVVQTNVALEPTGTPETVDVRDAVFVITAVPLVTDHAPVPELGLFAFSVNAPSLHLAWSAPAFDAVGEGLTVTVITLEYSVSVPLVTFLRK